MKPIRHDKVDKKYMGIEGKKIHDSQMQFSTCIIVVKMIEHGCKCWIVICSYKLDG
jgi:hypothetical protein